MKFKAVVFDWAGTTIDYGCFSPLGAFVEAFKSYGLDISIEEAREPMGMLKLDHTKALLDLPRVREQFRSHYNRDVEEKDICALYECFEKSVFSTLKDYVKLNPYVRESIESLRARGLKIGSTTGYTKAMMDIILPLAKDQGYIPDFCIASDELGYGRPYPYMMYENARKLGIYPMSAIVKVGDTIVDMQEGKNAGCACIGVVLGSSLLGLSQSEVASLPKEELQARKNAVRVQLYEAGADRVIDDFSELEASVCDLDSKL